MTYPIDDYQNTFDPEKNYEKILFRSGKGVQAREINDLQEALMHRQKVLSDVLMQDGALVKDAAILVDEITGLVQLEAGSVYLRGLPREVDAASFTVPVVGVVTVGVRYIESIVTELEAPELSGLAEGRNFGEPGAARLHNAVFWGWDGDGWDGDGEFYAVYTIINGYVLSKEPPPALDGVNIAIARYDVDSAGGNYIIKGLAVAASFDKPTNKQTILIGEGRARVNGYGVEIPRGIRMVLDAEVDTLAIVAEPRTYTPSGGSMRVNLDNGPLLSIQQIRYTKQTTVTLTRGAVAGGRDPLPDSSVLSLVSVTQGGTTYAIGTEVRLTSGEVDWSGAGAEPSPGSTYSVTYQHNATTGATVTARDDDGFTISGPVAGTLFTIDYTFALSRVDAIVVDSDGRVERLKGVATEHNPVSPTVPDTQLRIASVSNNWRGNPVVQSDATITMPMQELRGMQALVFDLFDLVALERLRSDIGLREPAAKRGVFVDSFNNNNLRDSGVTQNAATFDGIMQLPIAATVQQVGTSITAPRLLPYALQTIIEQPYKTGTMLVNPYQAFEPLPPSLTLSPAVDFWTEANTTWTDNITRKITQGAGALVSRTTSQGVEVVGTTVQEVEFLREIAIQYRMEGMGAGEVISAMTFDGIAVTPSATTANSLGVVTGNFTIPAGVSAGTKAVRVDTGSGAQAVASFTGRGTITTEERRIVVTETSTRYDPLAQTFTLSESRHFAGADLWFSNRGDRDVLVQLRNTQTGMPGATIIAETRIKPAEISVTGPTRVLFDGPVWLTGGTEYALIILTDSATTAMHIAQLGQFDATAQRHITAQPYQVGVLLSSSNASTWTAHQDKDLTFRMLACEFTATAETIGLGSVTVAGVTDLLAALSFDIPATGVRAEFRAIGPDGTIYRMAPDTPIALPAAVSGVFNLEVQLQGTATVSPVLYPGIQFITGVLQTSGVYVSRAFPVGTSARVSVNLEVFKPGTSSFACEIQNNAGTWVALPLVAGVDVGDGWIEHQYLLASHTATQARLRLTMSGNAAARPLARKLRAVATD